MKPLKLAILGAGSSYTPELLDELARRRDRLEASEIRLYDIDEKRLETMGGFCRRFAKRLGLGAEISTTTDLDRALDGVDFIDTQIRVGGNQQRVLDERIPLQHGLVGQETTGAGGMMKAMRTIPVMLDIARHVERLCPEAWIINYTNPTGLITEAVTRYTKARIAGFCSGGIFPKMWAGRALGIEYSRVQYDYVGLNHLNFMSNITIDGRPLTPTEWEVLIQEDDSLDPDLVNLLGVLPSPYLQYFYHTTARVKEWSEAPLTRGGQVMELEKEIYEAYADPEADEKPAALAKRGGGGYSEVAIGFVHAVHNNVDTEMVVNVPNNGAVDFLPDSAVVEIPCLVNSRGMAPLRVAKVPDMCWGLIAAVKNYEQLAVEAAVEGDVRKMKLALLAHPLVREWALVETLVPELLEANKAYLPQFHL